MGERVLVSGHGAQDLDGSPTGPFDRVPDEVSPEQAMDSAKSYGTDVNRDLIPAWWSLRCLSNVRWLVEHGYGPPEEYPEVAVLRSRLEDSRARRHECCSAGPHSGATESAANGHADVCRGAIRSIPVDIRLCGPTSLARVQRYGSAWTRQAVLDPLSGLCCVGVAADMPAVA